MYDYETRSIDAEAHYVIFPKSDGLLVGIRPDTWDRCMERFAGISPQYFEGFSVPQGTHDAWGYGHCLSSANLDLFDKIVALDDWIWWQCYVPRSNISQPNISKELRDTSQTLDTLFSIMSIIEEGGIWDDAQNQKQLVIVNGLTAGRQYPSGAAVNVSLSKALCQWLFSHDDVDAVMKRNSYKSSHHRSLDCK